MVLFMVRCRAIIIMLALCELFSYMHWAKNVLVIGYGIGTLTDAVLMSPHGKKSYAG